MKPEDSMYGRAKFATVGELIAELSKHPVDMSVKMIEGYADGGIETIYYDESYGALLLEGDRNLG